MVVAEDAFLVREALRQILSEAPGIEVARACGDRDSLLEAIRQDRPDVVLTDIRMPPTGGAEGIQVARMLSVTSPQTGVVVLSQFADPSYFIAFLESGFSGRAYLLKERVRDAGQIVSAVEAVAAGECVIDPKVVEVLVSARERSTDSPLSALTPRECDVIAEIAQGKSNAAIAESLVLTKRAVEKHINAIFLKLGLSNADGVSRRVKAALLFLAGGGETNRRNGAGGEA